MKYNEGCLDGSVAGRWRARDMGGGVLQQVARGRLELGRDEVVERQVGVA
jgi:hypothetical protein